MLFFAMLGYGIVAVLLIKIVPRTTVAVVAAGLPLGMGWVTRPEMATDAAFWASTGLSLAIAAWAALIDLKGIVHFMRDVQWGALWHMTRGGKVLPIEEEITSDVEVEEEQAGERA
ncbi:MAG: hypothetical protein AAB367_03920 [Patescibacteria group bacterium]